MTCLGPDVVEIFKSVTLTSMEAIDINVIHKRFTQHFSPRSNEMYERFLFNKIAQKPGKCGGTGHFEAVCKAKRVDAEILNEETFKKKTVFVHTAVAASNFDDWYEKVTINGEQFVFKLDTGAQCSLLPLNQARRLRLTVSVTKSENVISFNGERTKIDGETNARCLIKDHESKLLFKLADLDFVPILGKNTSEKEGLQKQTSKFRFKMHFLNCSMDWGARKAINTTLIW
jgi:hypothetical protein